MPIEIDPAGVMQRAVLKLADFRDARVLEVGAGDGRLTFQYATVPHSVVAIDTKEADIQAAARHRGAKLSNDVRFLCANAITLPFSGEQFGIVLQASSL